MDSSWSNPFFPPQKRCPVFLWMINVGISTTPPSLVPLGWNTLPSGSHLAHPNDGMPSWRCPPISPCSAGLVCPVLLYGEATVPPMKVEQQQVPTPHWWHHVISLGVQTTITRDYATYNGHFHWPPKCDIYSNIHIAINNCATGHFWAHQITPISLMTCFYSTLISWNLVITQWTWIKWTLVPVIYVTHHLSSHCTHKCSQPLQPHHKMHNQEIPPT